MLSMCWIKQAAVTARNANNIFGAYREVRRRWPLAADSRSRAGAEAWLWRRTDKGEHIETSRSAVNDIFSGHKKNILRKPKGILRQLVRMYVYVKLSHWFIRLNKEARHHASQCIEFMVSQFFVPNEFRLKFSPRQVLNLLLGLALWYSVICSSVSIFLSRKTTWPLL